MIRLAEKRCLPLLSPHDTFITMGQLEIKANVGETDSKWIQISAVEN